MQKKKREDVSIAKKAEEKSNIEIDRKYLIMIIKRFFTNDFKHVKED